MSGERQLSLLESADLLGRYRYFELALFGLCGARALELDGGSRQWCSGAARAHAWRAALFEELLPVSVGLPDATSATRPAGGAPALLAALWALPADALVAALTETCYPAMGAAYRARLEMASRYSDPPVVRALERAIADLRAVTAGAPGARAARLDPIGQELALLIASGGGPFGPLSREDADGGRGRALP